MVTFYVVFEKVAGGFKQQVIHVLLQQKTVMVFVEFVLVFSELFIEIPQFFFKSGYSLF